jgi:hypothetical protein
MKPYAPLSKHHERIADKAWKVGILRSYSKCERIEIVELNSSTLTLILIEL